MNQIVFALGFLTISQLLFMGLFYVVHFRKSIIGRWIVLLSLTLIGVVVTILLYLAEAPYIYYYVSVCFALAAPAILWIVANYLFVDEHRISPVMWFLLFSYQIVRALNPLFLDPTDLISRISVQISYLIMFLLCVHVIVRAINGRNVDLVEERRRLRVPFSLGLGVAISVTVLLASLAALIPAASASNFIAYASLPCFSAIFLLTMGLNLVTVNQLHESSLLANMDKPAQPSRAESAEPKKAPYVDKVSPKVINRIRQLMEVEKLYQDSNLTISSLANKMSLRENSLRKLINQGLGYRNFNQFLNFYRINEASQKLLEFKPEDRQSIADISLEVGYASLSSFNKAFKEIKGVTPSFYRNNHTTEDAEEASA